MVRYLCQLVGVSRSGYYRYFSDEAVAKRQTDHQADETSDKITLDIALNTVKKLKKNRRKLAEGAFIHSDQGVHYTSPHFQKLVKKVGLGQVNVTPWELLG